MMDRSLEVSLAPSPIDPSVVHIEAEPAVPDAPLTVRVRVTDSPRRLEAWSLVLVSSGMQSMTQWIDGSFELHVAHADAAAAIAELDAADAEERHTQRARQTDAQRERGPATRHAVAGSVFMSVLLLAFFAVTGPRAADSAWFTAGASHAERVLHGEWWRAVTALTLHADGAHVLSNVGIGTLAVGAVMRTQGVGWGSALVLASGTLGNLLNAWAQHPLHRSVGFSTAVFGAIGILGGLAYVHGRQRSHTQRPAWTALGGSLALLAVLGSSERSDLFAHLFGGLAGVGIGLLAGYIAWRPKTVLGQLLAGLGAAGAVVGAWLGALA